MTLLDEYFCDENCTSLGSGKILESTENISLLQMQSHNGKIVKSVAEIQLKKHN